MKKGKGAVIIVLILACLGLLVWNGYTVVQQTRASQQEADKKSEGIKLGLDLSGGVSVTYQVVDENASDADIKDTMRQLEQRAGVFSTEYSVYQIGNDRIAVEIPGVFNPDEVFAKLGSPGTLYFIAHKDADGNENYTYNSTTGAYELTKTIEELQANGGIVLDGTAVKSAKAEYSGDKNSVEGSKPVVSLQFYDEQAAIWKTATETAYNGGTNSDTIGVYYDGEFISVPKVNSVIGDGQCIIEGEESYEAADELATYIRIGAMKVELEELTARVQGAQLGSDALASAVKAALIGLALVMLFMIIMYGLSGVAASVALGVYTTLVVALINWFEITLTLPGIAGVILGIGMAVDANVITFARIREEIAAGKTVSAAIKEGYSKAFSAILDGNITTFIAAFVLMVLGSGTVKGFAYTLMISILTSMFTALVVARLFLNACYAVGLENEKLYGRAKERKSFDFMKHRVVYFAISLIIIVVGFVTMGINSASDNGALNYSLEFKGGSSTTVDLKKDFTIEQLEKEVAPVVAKAAGIETSEIQVTTVNDSTKVEFKTPALSDDQRADISNALHEKYDIDQEKGIESETISSTISNEMRRDAVIAVIVACIFMLLYIWFRFKDLRFATSAILALVHDVLIVLTTYAVVRISVGNTFIACMLTIVGYSVNDTIVIFDRIRENLHGASARTPEALADVANKSLTQTLSRSINTSITTIIMVLLLFILGVTSIREFALPLLVGMICGSYSSIFIATELWYVMKLHLGKNKIK